MRERLESWHRTTAPARIRLEKDIEASRQCLEVCKVASSEVSTGKIYRIKEAVADGDSDQMLVTTLTDLFNIEKALSQGKSAQLLGSMSDETPQKVSEQRYSSRFRNAHAAGRSTWDTHRNLKPKAARPLVPTW
ncbi:unnamed protein product, partial [Clonostachys chloroleuca]